MKKGLLGILAMGMMSTAANAGTLAMRFVGGGTEITMGPSDTATIEITFAMGALDKAKNKVTGIDARLDVGPLVTDAANNYVQDGSVKDVVTSVTPGAFANWNTAASSGTPGPFNGSFFLSAGDPAGVSGPVGNGTNQAPVVILSFTIHKLALSVPAVDTYIVFRQVPPLPSVYNGSVLWANRFGADTVAAAEQFETGTGNPGDNRPGDQYSGFETLAPLIIHQVPEPSALALLALGGFAAMRRRK